MAQQVKDLALSLLWRVAGKFLYAAGAAKKKKRQTEGPGQCMWTDAQGSILTCAGGNGPER